MKALVVADPSRVDRLSRPLETAGVEVALSLAPGRGKLDRVRWSRQVARDARAGQDVIISHEPGPICLVAAREARRAGCPFVARWRLDPWQEYGDEMYQRKFFGLKSAWGKRMLNQIIGQTDLIVPVSRTLGDITIERTGCDPATVIPVPIPVDTERFAPGDPAAARAALGIEHEHVITIALVFYYEEKIRGLAEFLPGLRALVDAHDDTAVLIVGDGLRREQFEADHAKVLDHPGIIMHGRGEDMPLVYRASDLFCHFSFFDSCPNVILEAWASGVPVVVNDYRPLTDLLSAERTGVVLDNSARPDDVREALEARAAMGDEGRREALEEFSYEAVGRRLVEALERVV